VARETINLSREKGKQKQQFELQTNSITKMNLPGKGTEPQSTCAAAKVQAQKTKTTINW